MSGSDPSFRSGKPSTGDESLRRAQDLVARAQRLADAPRPAEGRPLEWYVETLHVGDLTTLAALTLRGSDSR